MRGRAGLTTVSPVEQGFWPQVRYWDTMSDSPGGELTCTAKLARVVLENQGPLSPSEVAEEARISEESAREGLSELAERGAATTVCGMCDSREELYELAERRA